MKMIRYTADWCASCQIYKDVFAKAVEDWNVSHEIVDVDEQVERAQDAKIVTLPTTVWLDNAGKEVHRLVGKRELPELVDAIKEFKDV